MVNVTQDALDIDSGSTRPEATCPIALAIMTDYPKGFYQVWQPSRMRMTASIDVVSTECTTEGELPN